MNTRHVRSAAPMILFRFYKTKLILIAMTFTMTSSQEQTSRNFPLMYNLALDRPITTDPAVSTCGVQSLGAFCRSSTVVSSVNSCLLSLCSQACPTRTRPPDFISLLEAGGYGTCVSADATTVRPGSSGISYSAHFRGSGSNCFLVPAEVPRIEQTGSWTLTFWVWLNGTAVG